MRTRWLLPFILAAALSPSPGWSASLYSDGYDLHIRSAVKKWWPDYPLWRAWKAQLYQESLLEPDAVSPVGARGLAQFMPKTWDEVARNLGIPRGVSPHDAKHAISAGAYYMAKLRRAWVADRTAIDRHRLAQASYNAGLGNLLRAQEACGWPAAYDAIITCLPRITGRHAAETTGYVRSIARWQAQLDARATLPPVRPVSRWRYWLHNMLLPHFGD